MISRRKRARRNGYSLPSSPALTTLEPSAAVRKTSHHQPIDLVSSSSESGSVDKKPTSIPDTQKNPIRTIDLSDDTARKPECVGILSDDDERKPAARTSLKRSKRKQLHQSEPLQNNDDDHIKKSNAMYDYAERVQCMFDQEEMEASFSYMNIDGTSNWKDDEGLARMLQKEETSNFQKEEKINEEAARRLSEEEDITQRRNQLEEKTQHEGMAKLLQEEEDLASRKANPEEERNFMMKTNMGRAVLVVERIIQVVDCMKRQFPSNGASCNEDLEPVTKDDMVYFAERLLNKQDEFRANGLPFAVDIGYHYTNKKNLDDIRANGLMSKAERDSSNIQAASKGAVFGDGIYTANNPKTFSSYGHMGLIVARLQGKAIRVPRSLKAPNEVQDATTIIGDKTASSIAAWPKSDVSHEFVLRSSSQCLPMIRYNYKSSLVIGGEAYIHRITDSLRFGLDELFNGDTKHALTSQASNSSVPASPGSFPLSARHFLTSSTSLTSQLLTNTSMTTAHPHVLHNRIIPNKLVYRAPKKLEEGIPSNAFTPYYSFTDEECVICQDKLLTESSITISACKHCFHGNCIKRALKVSNQCPVCRKAVGEPRGKSPSGTMKISTSPHQQCAGYPGVGAIVIMYQIKSGRQKSYHENPGQIQSGKLATAYLPNNSDGQKLLKRLQYAFLHGLTFTVGASLTTGALNQCTWSSVHHKTSLSGGIRSHGFPDVSYIANCNDELNGLGVPMEHLLQDDGTSV